MLRTPTFRRPTLRRPGRGLWRSPAVAVVILLVLTAAGMGAGMHLDRRQGPRWTATTDILVKLASADAMLLGGGSDSVSISDQIDASSLATSRDVLSRAADELKFPGGPAELRTAITAAPQGSSHVIVIEATTGDAASAQRAADVVADTFVTMNQQRLAALAASLPPPAGPDANSDVLLRAQLLTKTLQPLQVFHDDPPAEISQVRLPVALGIVGLAAGALVALALMFLGRRVDRPRDAQRLLSLPAVPYHRERGGPAAARLVRGLRNRSEPGELLVCPVDAEAEDAASRFADWTREQAPAEPAHDVRVVAEPTSAVVGTRPEPGEAGGLLLVVPKGTSRQVLADAAALLATWRPVDAVVVTT